MYKTPRLIVAILALVTCVSLAQAQTPPPAANPGRGLIVMAPGCVFRLDARRIHAGQSIPADMSLHNTGQWCAGSLTMSASSGSGARIVDRPNHGELRMGPISGGIMFIYRPGPGYQGSDSFLIALPAGGGYDYNLVASVTVTP